MKLEINLWFNRTSTNGQLNVNAGEYVLKFTNLVDIDRFATQAITRGIVTNEEFLELAQTLDLDPDANYAWIGDDFVCWNKNSKNAQAFYSGKLYTIPMNTHYKQTYKGQPHASFKVVI